MRLEKEESKLYRRTIHVYADCLCISLHRDFINGPLYLSIDRTTFNVSSGNVQPGRSIRRLYLYSRVHLYVHGS